MKVSLMKRLGAWFIDFAIASTASVLLLFITSSEALFNLVFDKDAMISFTLISLIELIQVGIVIQIILTFYYVIIPFRNNGQTFGKRMMKIKVIAEDGEAANFSALYLRQVVGDQLLNALTLGASLIINTIVILYRKDNRSMFDMLAKTKVVYVDEEE